MNWCCIPIVFLCTASKKSLPCDVSGWNWIFHNPSFLSDKGEGKVHGVDDTAQEQPLLLETER